MMPSTKQEVYNISCGSGDILADRHTHTHTDVLITILRNNETWCRVLCVLTTAAVSVVFECRDAAKLECTLERVCSLRPALSRKSLTCTALTRSSSKKDAR